MAVIRESWEKILHREKVYFSSGQFLEGGLGLVEGGLKVGRSYAVQKWRRQPMAARQFAPIFLILPQTLAVVSPNWSDSNSGEREIFSTEGANWTEMEKWADLPWLALGE